MPNPPITHLKRGRSLAAIAKYEPTRASIPTPNKTAFVMLLATAQVETERQPPSMAANDSASNPAAATPEITAPRSTTARQPNAVSFGKRAAKIKIPAVTAPVLSESNTDQPATYAPGDASWSTYGLAFVLPSAKTKNPHVMRH